MSNLFINSGLRPHVGPSKIARPIGRPCPGKPGGISDIVHKFHEKCVEKTKEKLFGEKLGDGKRCGEKFGDKRTKEKFGDKGCREKFGDKL